MTSNELWRINNPEKARTHYIVQNSLRKGDIAKQNCEKCNNIKTHAHHDDYTKPLDIRWLCASCHSQYHKSLRDKTRPPKVKRLYKRNRKGREIIINPFKKDMIHLKQLGYTYKQISDIIKLSSSQCYKIINNTSYD